MELLRPRLIRRLNQAVLHPVTAITAPAGSGKTVLIDQWAAQHHGPVVARVTLDRGDDWRTAAARINAALPSRDETILVIDAADSSSDELLAKELAVLAERASTTVHLVLVIRSRAVPVVRALRGRTDVRFFNAAHLAFTRLEARQLVMSGAGVLLTDAALDRLMTSTEGWAAGVHMAAIGLREAPDPDLYMDAFSGDERHVAGFLMDEVLDEQPAEVRRFLIATSVLDRLNGALCDALTGGADGTLMLRQLESSGVFLRRVRGSHQWFAYNNLFRQLLRRELRRGEYGEEATLLVQAAVWHDGRDEAAAAARYLIEAEAWDELVDLADKYGRRMYESGQTADVLHWLNALPASHLRHASVAVRRAYLHSMLGESRQASQIVHDLDVRRLSRGEKVTADALRAVWTFFDASPESTIEAADDALRALERIDTAEIPDIFGLTSPPTVAVMAAASRARALWHLGRVADARRVLSAGIALEGVATPWIVRTLSSLAVLEAWAGNLRMARAHAGRALLIARDGGLVEHPTALDARLAVASVCRQRGDQPGAAKELEEVGAIASRTRRPFQNAMLAVEWCRWHLAAGDPGQGLGALARHRETSELPAPPLIEANLYAVEANLYLALDDVERAASIVDSAPEAPYCADLAAVAVHVRVAQHDIAGAVALLDRWETDDAQPSHSRLHAVWDSVVEYEAGERRRAIESMSVTLNAAASEGDVRLFLDGGRPVERVLRAVLHGTPSRFVEQVVRSAGLARGPAGEGAVGLSRRELEVARYLPTPLSSAEIAQQLYISLNTLKTHLRTIYNKLGATNRREAIQRAEELGIA